MTIKIKLRPTSIAELTAKFEAERVRRLESIGLRILATERKPLPLKPWERKAS